MTTWDHLVEHHVALIFQRPSARYPLCCCHIYHRRLPVKVDQFDLELDICTVCQSLSHREHATAISTALASTAIAIAAGHN